VWLRGALDDWVKINPGDIIVADDDGIISVPKKIADQAAAMALTATQNPPLTAT